MIIVIGGGPAGFFAAITARRQVPAPPVLLLEEGGQVLRKVAVSGGGRCNVTNACADPRELAAHYPRGGRELRGPFSRWSTGDTRQWFEQHGVPLKTEPDGRVFPRSDSSASIVDCLRDQAGRLGVDVRLRQRVAAIAPAAAGFRIELADGQSLTAQKVLLACGGGRGGMDLAAGLGHTLMPPVPSLFTFHCDDEMLQDMAGVAAEQVALKALGQGLPKKGLEQEGPLLITHWGVSGPAVLKLSAWGARLLHDCGYRFRLRVDWCPATGREPLTALLATAAADQARKQLGGACPVNLPRRLWHKLLLRAGLSPDKPWGETGRKGQARLVEVLKGTELAVDGKSVFKEEFVTCGGVKLAEVDFRTMESRLVPGLHFAGEVLDVDGITGGFNFQACWTTGHLAGQAMAAGPEGDQS